MKNKYCAHCYPAPANHWADKYLGLLETAIVNPLCENCLRLIPNSLLIRADKYLASNFLKVMNWLARGQYADQIDRQQFFNRTLVLWDQAKSMGLQIYNLKIGARHTCNFLLKINGRKLYFEQSPVALLNAKHKKYWLQTYDDKAKFRAIMEKHGLPCARGRVFSNLRAALKYGEAIGYPLVAKPANSSLSRHVVVNINSAAQLKSALKIVRQISWRAVVEKQIHGFVHRAVVLDDQLLACAKRLPAGITGDARRTISQLIDRKNAHPWRGRAEQKDCTLHQVEKNQRLREFLAKQQLTLESILPRGRTVLLSDKINTGNGADIHNVTEQVCGANLELFKKINQVLQMRLAGYDFICQDAGIPWFEQEFGFIESNSLPYIDMHHYPSHGRPINAARAIWEAVLIEK